MRIPGKLVVVIIAVLSASQAVAWEIEKSFSVGSGGQLVLTTERGSIDIEIHLKEAIDVRIEIEGFDEDQVRVDFDQSGNDLNIDAEVDRRVRGRKRIRFLVTVPKSYNLDLSTEGGSIQVEDLQGKIEAETSGGSLGFFDIVGNIDGRTSGGSIDIQRADGKVDIRTSGGSIDVEDVTGNVFADTSGGTISVENVGGDLESETSGGSIRIVDVRGSVEAETSGGSIRAEFSQQPNGDVNMSTSGGGITVELADEVGMTLRARAAMVYSDFPVNGATKGKKRLYGDINAGGPDLDLHTSGGSIKIRRS